MTLRSRRLLPVFALLILIAAPSWAEPLRVVATTPDLGDLVRQVGGDEVELKVLARGPQDPHFVEPRPSFVRALHRADLFVQMGMELEVGWVPRLLQSARNPDIAPGGENFVDASTAISPLEVPQRRVDRSMGDVHPYGNPHYLSDPLNGLRVARLLRDELAEVRPERAADFDARYRDFARRLVGALVGEALLADADPETVARRLVRGELPAEPPLGGWLGAMASHAGTAAVQDHRLWPYFAARFRLVLVDTLEPRPGIAPTTSHLSEVVTDMKRDGVRLVLSSTYFDPRHARWISEHTGARVAAMAHQVGATDGTDDYIAMIDHNVRAVLDAL